MNREQKTRQPDPAGFEFVGNQSKRPPTGAALMLAGKLLDDRPQIVRVLFNDPARFLKPGWLGFLDRLWFVGSGHGPMVQRETWRPLAVDQNARPWG